MGREGYFYLRLKKGGGGFIYFLRNRIFKDNIICIIEQDKKISIIEGIKDYFIIGLYVIMF